MKKLLSILCILLLCAGCSSPQETTYVPHKKTTYLGPFNDIEGNMVIPLNTDVFIMTTDDSNAEDMINDFNKTVVLYHKFFDSHHLYANINNIKTINDNYGLGPVEVDEKIIDILTKAINLSKETNGYFNPTMGSISDVWTDLFTIDHKNVDPSKEAIDDAMACVLDSNSLEEYIVIDEKNSTVELKKHDGCKSKVEIDLGAYSKGYVLDKAYEELLKYDTGFMLSAGSSSIITYVPKRAIDLHFNIGITNPNNPETMLCVIEVDNKAISTSGDYQQYFINEDGIRRHHILNPFTGYSENNYRGITLIADSDAGLLDAISTSIYSMSYEDLDNNLEKIKSIEHLDLNKLLIVQDDDGKLQLIKDDGIQLN